jgi:quinoprotein glucose dehydrogenase
MSYPPANGLLGTRLDRLLAGQVAPAATLDLLEAAEKRKQDEPLLAAQLAKYEAARPKDDPLAAWRECEQGGDPERGRRLFFERNDLQCLKCHRVGGEGAGESGPDLAGVATRGGRDYLLESIVLPNRKIAVGFTNTIFVLDDGDIVDGRVVGETPTHWIAVTTDRGAVQIRKSAVVSSRSGLSAMPKDLAEHASKRDLRDLVGWLATLK